MNGLRRTVAGFRLVGPLGDFCWLGRPVGGGPAVVLRVLSEETAARALPKLDRLAAAVGELPVVRPSAVVPVPGGVAVICPHLPGGDVARLIQHRGRLAAPEAVAVAVAAAAVFELAAELGVPDAVASLRRVLVDGRGRPTLDLVGAVVADVADSSTDVHVDAPALVAAACWATLTGAEPQASAPDLDVAPDAPSGVVLAMADPGADLAGFVDRLTFACPPGPVRTEPLLRRDPAAAARTEIPPRRGFALSRASRLAASAAAGVALFWLVLAGWGGTAQPARAAPRAVAWRQVAIRIEFARDRALLRADPAALSAVYTRDCPARAADLRWLRWLVGRGERLAGYRPQVLAVRLLSRIRPGTVQLLVVDRIPPFRLMQGAGAPTWQSSGRPARGTVVTLVRGGPVGWRVAALADVSKQGA